MAMKDTTITSKVESHGKLMRMRILMMEAMMMGTLKVASGEINRVLRRKRGTRGSIRILSSSRDGVCQQLLPYHPHPLDLPPSLTGVANLKTPTALPGHLIRRHSHRLQHSPKWHCHPALDRILVRLPVLQAGEIGVQKPWQWQITETSPHHHHHHLRLRPRAGDTASKVASLSLLTILTSPSKIGLMLLLRPST